jgi:RimJ/RimL family protein N-acetyltransferase
VVRHWYFSRENQPVHFELQPVLSGQLLELGPLLRSDHDRLYRAAADPLIWVQHPVPDRWQRSTFDAYFEDRIASGGALIAIEKRTGEVAGASEFNCLNLQDSKIEIGATFLATRFWGGAYNGEMKRLMVEHALSFVERVVFSVSERNLRSRAAMAKIGAKTERTFQKNGIPYLLFSIRRSEWAGNQDHPRVRDG